MPEKDTINPSYYKGVLRIPKDRLHEFIDDNGDLSLEYIEVMEFLMTHEEFRGHLKGQAWKYMLRLGGKDNEAQELSKSGWYIDRLTKWFKRNGNR